MIWWIGGSVCVLLIVALVVGLFMIYQAATATEKRMERDGVVVIGWIVVANERLHDETHSSRMSYAQVVYVPDFEAVPNLEATLEEWAEELREYALPENASKEERIIWQVMDSHVPYFEPIRLPDEITDGREAYTVTARVYRKQLPLRRLSRPYILMRVVLKTGEHEMIDYPDADEERQRTLDEDD